MKKIIFRVTIFVFMQCVCMQIYTLPFFRSTTDLPETTIPDASKNLTQALKPKYPWQKIDENKIANAQTYFLTAAQSNPGQASGALKVLVDKYQEEGITNADDAAKLSMLYETLLDTKPPENDKTYRELIRSIVDKKPYYSETDALNELLSNPLSKSSSGNRIDNPTTKGEYLLNARILLDAPEVDSLLEKAHYKKPTWFEDYQQTKLAMYQPQTKAPIAPAPKPAMLEETAPLTPATFEPTTEQQQALSLSDIDISTVPAPAQQLPPAQMTVPQEPVVEKQKVPEIFSENFQIPFLYEISQSPAEFKKLNLAFNEGVQKYAYEMQNTDYEKNLKQKAIEEAQKKKKKPGTEIIYHPENIEILRELYAKSINQEGPLLRTITAKQKLNEDTSELDIQLKQQQQKTKELGRLLRVLNLLERAMIANKKLQYIDPGV